MATTALIVEIVVIGAFALVWVGLFAFKLFGLDVSVVTSWLSQYKDWSNGVALIISYQLGWSVNQISYFVARKTFNKTIKRKIFKNEYKNYDSIKATVFIKGSTFTLDRIRERLSVVRLTRSVFINFLPISIGFFVLEKWYVGFVAMGITIIFLSKQMIFILNTVSKFSLLTELSIKIIKRARNNSKTKMTERRYPHKAAEYRGICSNGAGGCLVCGACPRGRGSGQRLGAAGWA